MDTNKIAFSGELMMLQWAESSTRGRTVTFLVNEDCESHPFKDFTIKAGKRSGQRFMAVLVQVDDNEQPVEQPKTLAQQAFLLCGDPEFWKWADARTFDSIDNEAAARAYICNLLGIKSRGELDRDKSAADGFNRFIAAPYNAHRQQVTPAL